MACLTFGCSFSPRVIKICGCCSEHTVAVYEQTTDKVGLAAASFHIHVAQIWNGAVLEAWRSCVPQSKLSRNHGISGLGTLLYSTAVLSSAKCYIASTPTQATRRGDYVMLVFWG